MVRTAGSVALCEISALDHEVLDDAVEFAAFVALAHGFLRQLLEVPDGFRDGVAEEADLDAADGLVADCNVEPNLVVGVYLRDNNRKEITLSVTFGPFLALSSSQLTEAQRAISAQHKSTFRTILATLLYATKSRHLMIKTSGLLFHNVSLIRRDE